MVVGMYDGRLKSVDICSAIGERQVFVGLLIRKAIFN